MSMQFSWLDLVHDHSDHVRCDHHPILSEPHHQGEGSCDVGSLCHGFAQEPKMLPFWF